MAHVFLNQPVVRAAVEDDAVLAVGPANIGPDGEMIAPFGGDDAVVSVMVRIVALDEQVIRVIVPIKAVLDVVVDFVVRTMHGVGAEGVNPEKIVVKAAVV